MSRFKIINLFDKLFVSTAIFLIIYAWINFYLRDLWITFLLSLIFTAACLFLLYYFSNKKKEKKSLTKKAQEKMYEFFLAFRLSSKQKKLELLQKILNHEYSTFLNNNVLTYIKDGKKHVIIIATHIEKLSDNDLINLIDEYCEHEAEVIDIICNETINLNTQLFTNKSIQIINKQKLYEDYFVKYNTYPDNSTINKKITKFNLKTVLKNVFQPYKAKSYFVCGLILIFSSIILPYRFYYIIFGSMLMLFAIICKLKNFAD